MADIPASVLSALIRDRACVAPLGDATRHRAAEGDTLVGAISFPFPVALASVLFRALPARASGAGVIAPAGTWRATVRAKGVEIAFAVIDLATLDPLKIASLPISGNATISAGDVVEVGLSPTVGATAIDAPSFSIWYLPA